MKRLMLFCQVKGNSVNNSVVYEIWQEKRKQSQEKSGKNHCPREADGFQLEQEGESKENEEMGDFHDDMSWAPEGPLEESEERKSLNQIKGCIEQYRESAWWDVTWNVKTELDGVSPCGL